MAIAVQRFLPDSMTSVILINGSFGVGKTSVARELRARLEHSAIYDPEMVGWVLRRLPPWIRLQGRGTDDFQDMPLWRRSVARGVRLTRATGRSPVLVPMTFSRLDYLVEVVADIRAFEPNVRVFCLRASLQTIRQRLRARGTTLEGSTAAWIVRQTEVCATVHADPRFGTPIDTERRSIVEVAERIVVELRGTSAARSRH